MQRSNTQRVFSETEEEFLSDPLRRATLDEITREHTTNVERLTKGTGVCFKPRNKRELPYCGYSVSQDLEDHISFL